MHTHHEPSISVLDRVEKKIIDDISELVSHMLKSDKSITVEEHHNEMWEIEEVRENCETIVPKEVIEIAY